jgi:hypothetical protein
MNEVEQKEPKKYVTPKQLSIEAEDYAREVKTYASKISIDILNENERKVFINNFLSKEINTFIREHKEKHYIANLDDDVSIIQTAFQKFSFKEI